MFENSNTKMKPVDFPGTNAIFGKDQPQYLPLPAMRLYDEHDTLITCWELSVDEIDAVTKSGRIYISMLNFGRPLTPLRVMAELSDLIHFSDEE